MDLRSKNAIESSKQHDIEMSNILIAEFMGLSIKKGVCYYTDSNDMFPMGVEVEKPYLPYDTSWNWLLPVIKKIKTLVIEQDEIDNPYNSDEYDKTNKNYELLNFITETLVQIEIKSVYQAVVEFIKNQND